MADRLTSNLSKKMHRDQGKLRLWLATDGQDTPLHKVQGAHEDLCSEAVARTWGRGPAHVYIGLKDGGKMLQQAGASHPGYVFNISSVKVPQLQYVR